jgi:nucleotide-binding universal stress UspA family protein
MLAFRQVLADAEAALQRERIRGVVERMEREGTPIPERLLADAATLGAIDIPEPPV